MPCRQHGVHHDKQLKTHRSDSVSTKKVQIILAEDKLFTILRGHQITPVGRIFIFYPSTITLQNHPF